jgi:ferrous iron transport protein B
VSGHCSTPAAAPYRGRRGRAAASVRLIALVGSPNVGKSVLFNALTGAYVTVSNYPGTTVEVARGRLKAEGGPREVVDTPGMYSLLPITDEERVTRRLLLQERPETVVHVADAKNLERLLPLTLQLLEAGLPLVLAVNMIDEAERRGLRLRAEELERRLGVPVVATAGISGRGLPELMARLAASSPAVPASPTVTYDPSIEAAAAGLAERLDDGYTLSRRALALLLLQEDPEILALVLEHQPGLLPAIQVAVEVARSASSRPPALRIALRRQEEARRLVEAALQPVRPAGRDIGERVSRLLVNPLTGLPILLAVLYFGLYQFVGVLGAGVLVNFLERRVFDRLLTPLLVSAFERWVPWATVRDLFVGEFGVLTLGLRYALAIVLPIVGTFFLAFSIMEDSGYFPRLALLVDRVFKKIGLNGRAVIPLVLGLGCDTMATMVTRTLETRRERVLATLLLALAIPCSAQLGVILAVLSARPLALVVWAAVILGVFLLVGALGARLLPGERPSFYMELPPLRLPQPGNVLVKTYTRMQWYLLEVLPFFLLASVAIWLGRVTGLFPLLIRVLQPVVGWLGLPREAAVVFLFGFFRRDYGAAGLYDLERAGLMSGRQLLVAAVTLTLFIPCLAQAAVMLKERGWKATLGIAAFILPFSFLVGFLLNLLLVALGVSL